VLLAITDTAVQRSYRGEAFSTCSSRRLGGRSVVKALGRAKMLTVNKWMQRLATVD